MNVLSATRVSKKYARNLRQALRYGVHDIAREFWPGASPRALRTGEFWAVDDVSFELGRGESLAIVGDNGAGKSSLLKILTGLLKPDSGEVRVRGRAEALIELGTGFHPLLTGRENISLGAALHGIKQRSARELEERVIDFADLGEFIDSPLQSYSTGMRSRLAYALAAHLEPDLLLVDEVLAVGDLAFQLKCATHLRGYLARGGSLLLVSHNPYQVQSMCQRALLLEHGRVTFSGSAVETLNRMFEQRHEKTTAHRPAAAAGETPGGPVSIDEVVAEPLHGETILTGEPLHLSLRYRAAERRDVIWGFSIWSPDQWVCVAGEADPSRRTLEAEAGELACVIPRLPLVSGRYALRAAMVDYETRQPLALYGWHDAPVMIDVRSPADAHTNLKMFANQLVTIDVEWR